MKINYYNTVEIISTVDESFSMTQKLDQWGTNLVKPYAGKTYHIFHIEGGFTAREMESDEGKKVQGLQHLKVILGLFLKRVAAFFNNEIKWKYTFVDTQKGEPFPLQSRVELIKQGNQDTRDCLNCLACCAICCQCCAEILSPPRRCPPGYYCRY